MIAMTFTIELDIASNAGGSVGPLRPVDIPRWTRSRSSSWGINVTGAFIVGHWPAHGPRVAHLQRNPLDQAASEAPLPGFEPGFPD